jgi:CPA2 family monovalent cation:H+ antiporter-2
MHNTDLILTISAGLVFALIFALITTRLGLSPIVGYLLAGVAVSPHTPGFVADEALAAQLAEIGVILLMFGVGLHFHVKDLVRVGKVALIGAVVQSTVATALCTGVAMLFGWSLAAGLVLGMAVSVASTVVLLRVLMDAGMLETRHGRIAVGWLIVEDIFTVLVLVLLPAAVSASHGGGAWDVVGAFGIAVLKLVAMAVLILVGGAKLIPWLLRGVARLRSRELFTLSILALALGIATGSYLLFGASMALGAFLAGMVVGQSEVHHQAAADALPMRDAFAVLFFVSVGMLFDPVFVYQNPLLVLAILGVVLIGKPLAAFVIVLAMRYPVRTALTAGLGLAQIGEFSFILGELGYSLQVIPSQARSVLVACALITITLNPLLFKRLNGMESLLRGKKRLWRVLNFRNLDELDAMSVRAPSIASPETVKAIVCGYGPVGRTLTRILVDFGVKPTVIDLNVDTVKALNQSGLTAVYGDSARREILEAAGVKDAAYLLICLPEGSSRAELIKMAKELNPALKVLVRARYIAEREALDKTKPSAVAYEEIEVAVALADMLLREIGQSGELLDREADKIRAELAPAKI